MHQATCHWDLFLETVSVLCGRLTWGTGSIHRTCHAGGFHWRVVGVHREGVGGGGGLYWEASGLEDQCQYLPVLASDVLLRAGALSQALEPLFPLFQRGLRLLPDLGC